MFQLLKDFWYEEEGLGTLEVVLILVVVLAMAVVFKKQIIGFFEGLMSQISGSQDEFKDIKINVDK